MSRDPIQLRAGPLTVQYHEGDLRYVRLGAREVLRRVLMLVRDQHWGTATNTYRNEHIDQGPDWFTITYDAVSRRGAVDFAWSAQLRGTAEGTLSFSFDGVARSTFLRNRLGLLVLHPGQVCAGAPARLETVDDRMVVTAFPTYIAPTQPFSDIAALGHEVAPGVWAIVRFTGEVFETEDQRNWSDASFKTYSGPTRRPFPVEVAAGTPVAQAMTLTLSGARPTAPVDVTAGAPSVTVGDTPVGRLPALGLGVASHGQPLTETEIERLRALPLSHLRVDLKLADSDWPARWRQAAAEAAALGVALEPALHVPEQPEAALAQLAAEAATLRPSVARWLVYRAGGDTVPTADDLSAARTHLSGAPIFGGSDAYFAQLNMNRPPLAALDGLCYASNPQGHTFDTLSMMETFEALAATVRSAQQFAAGKPLVLSPLTLRPRFNPATNAPEPPPPPGELPFETDTRQRQPAGAAWTLGSLAAVAQTGGVASLTYYETTGGRGVMEAAAGAPDPTTFPSQPGELFPIYQLFAALAAWRDAEVLPVTVSDPLRVAGLALRDGTRRTLFVANLTDKRLTVQAAGRRVELDAYEWQQVDG